MPLAKLSVLCGNNFELACVNIEGRANFASAPDFKRLLDGLAAKKFRRILIELSGCALMDSTFLGVLVGFARRQNPAQADGAIQLNNVNPRVAELFESLGTTHLFQMTAGPLPLPDDVQACTPEATAPTREQLTRISLEAHETLRAISRENYDRFKDVALFLAEDLRNLENPE
jgi:anti-anti-sigma factor